MDGALAGLADESYADFAPFYTDAAEALFARPRTQRGDDPLDPGDRSAPYPFPAGEARAEAFSN